MVQIECSVTILCSPREEIDEAVQPYAVWFRGTI
jgi:hypothetical protein